MAEETTEELMEELCPTCPERDFCVVDPEEFEDDCIHPSRVSRGQTQ